jgi:periplasmic protein CpxP/Spy
MIAFMKELIRRPIFAAWFVLVILASALPGQSEDKMAKVQAVAQQLQLTPEQKVKVLPILEQEAPKLEAIKNNNSLSGLQKMRQLRAIHAETAPQLQQILSPAQYQKLQAIREERIKEAMEKKRAGR